MDRVRHRGFTLVELAVVMFVLALLLAGALIPLTTQMEVRSIAETRRVMDQINEALIGFAQTTGRLPCPATSNIASGTGTAGTEVRDVAGTGCNSLIGVIPWSTLGVPETDAWGRRFTYRVGRVFSDDNSLLTWQTTAPPAPATQSVACTAPTPTPSSPTTFALCSLGEIAVRTRNVDSAGARGTNYLGTGLAAVFVSHGRNGFGGYQSTGVQINSLNVAADESTNILGTTQLTPTNGLNTVLSFIFYSRAHTTTITGCSDADAAAASTPFCEFDDITYMIPAATLASRMISAGRLP